MKQLGNEINGSNFEQCYNDVNTRFNEFVTQFENPLMKIQRDQSNAKCMTLLTCIQY